jgi:hypothetical protein
MSIINKLANLLSPRPQSTGRYMPIYVKCNRCGEKISGRVDLWNELSPEYEGGTEGYICRKVLMGSGICFQRIEVQLTFSGKKRLLSQEVIGGEAIEAEEFYKDA